MAEVARELRQLTSEKRLYSARGPCWKTKGNRNVRRLIAHALEYRMFGCVGLARLRIAVGEC